MMVAIIAIQRTTGLTQVPPEAFAALRYIFHQPGPKAFPDDFVGESIAVQGCGVGNIPHFQFFSMNMMRTRINISLRINHDIIPARATERAHASKISSWPDYVIHHSLNHQALYLFSMT